MESRMSPLKFHLQWTKPAVDAKTNEIKVIFPRISIEFSLFQLKMQK